MLSFLESRNNHCFLFWSNYLFYSFYCSSSSRWKVAILFMDCYFRCFWLRTQNTLTFSILLITTTESSKIFLRCYIFHGIRNRKSPHSVMCINKASNRKFNPVSCSLWSRTPFSDANVMNETKYPNKRFTGSQQNDKRAAYRLVSWGFCFMH